MGDRVGAGARSAGPDPGLGGAQPCKIAVSGTGWRVPTGRRKRRIIEAGLFGEVSQVHCWSTSGSYHGMNAVRTHVGSQATRVVGYSRTFPTAPGGEPADWELGLIDFASGAMGV